MVRAMNIRVDFCNELPDAFIVGIGYPVTGSLGEMLHQVMHLGCETSWVSERRDGNLSASLRGPIGLLQEASIRARPIVLDQKGSCG
jgi:hypothetical protein